MELATEQKTVAGEQTLEIKGAIAQFPYYLQRESMAPGTTRNFTSIISRMAKIADLNNPESYKEQLAKLTTLSNNSKVTYCAAYTVFLKSLGRTWTPPTNLKYKQGLPEFLPTEKEIDQLIAGCGPKTSVLLQLIKETGFRLGEALSLTWLSVDLEKRKVTLAKAEKGSLPRIFNISPTLTDMLCKLHRENSKVFGKMTNSTAENSFRVSRKTLARKLNNPRLAKIHFHLIRHWFGTTQYHKKPDLEYTRKLLGHKSVLNTQIYLHLDLMYFGESPEDFICRIATTKEERIACIEQGFDLVEKDAEGWYFRKRK